MTAAHHQAAVPYAPPELVRLPQWIGWLAANGEGKQFRLPNGQLTPKPLKKQDKPQKLPINPRTGGLANITEPATWGTFEQATAAVKCFGLTGVGFVFTDKDSYCGIDLDNCRNPETGEITAWAMKIIQTMNSYTEVSPFQHGVKITIVGTIPPNQGNQTKVEDGKVEMFSRARYFAWTGLHLDGTPYSIESRQLELTTLHSQLFASRNNGSQNNTNARTTVCGSSPDDHALLQLARKAANGGKFKRLFDDGIFADYSSQSEADLALCQCLAFWTGNDPARIDLLFRQSALMRDKWERPDYREQTIQKAIVQTRETYNPPRKNGAESQRNASAAVSKPAAVKKIEESQATQLLKMVEGVEYFHSPEGRAYATAEVNSHFETHLIRSRAFRMYLSRRYYREKRNALSSGALQDALGVLEGRALFDGEKVDVYCRVGRHANHIYIDLGTEKWDAIELTPTSWTVVSRPPVKFRRARGMMALPYPIRDPNGEKYLRNYLNVRMEEDLVLLKMWVLAALSPDGPYPILVLNGPHGSAKTTVSRILRSLIDPNEAAMRTLPKEERDLMIAGTNSWVIALDNLSHIPDWVSDALCRISTGGGFATRELHSDEDEILFNVKRPLILNGISEIATRGDLMDRCIIVTLIEIDKRMRKPEKKFWIDFEQHQAGIMGYFLDGLSGALANIESVVLKELPRMADFAMWATAGEQALGIPQGKFLNAYTANQNEANESVLEASVVARHLRSFLASMPARCWEGSATDLLKNLSELASEQEQREKSWPKNPRTLSNEIRRLQPNLKKADIEVQFSRDKNARQISLTMAPA
jgi:hypothetical protein